MSALLPSATLVSALLRRVNHAGGIAVVRARGDDRSGAILLILDERGAAPRLLERVVGRDGAPILAPAGPAGGADEAGIESYWRRRRAGDPDLWVIELDIASAERFAAETILAG